MDTDRSGEATPLAGLVAGQYEIERALGSGGMGVVYLARDTRLKRHVAIKTILDSREDDPVVRERFARETRVASRINHPYVATVFDVVEHEGRLLLVMEYLTGRSLDEVLRDGRPTPRQIARWLVEIAEALAAIHGAGVVHRDMKPGNVMITESGHVKVTDFGLARRATLPETTTVTEAGSLTREGTTLGTLLYMSPEQLRGEAADERSDQFSFGILAWQALTGAHPFARASTAEAISAMLNDPPEVRAGSPVAAPSHELHAVVLRLLSKDPAERFDDADSVVAELRKAVRVTAAPPLPHARARYWLRLAAAFVLSLVVLGAAGAWWLRQPPSWEGARYVVAVAPFQYPADDDEARSEAAMIADLLTRDLQASYLIRAEGPEELQLAGLSPLRTLNELGVRISDARETDYIVLGTLERRGNGWVVAAAIKPAREGRSEPPPMEVSGDGALALAEGLAAALRRRLPDVSRLTALRDDRVDLARLTSESNAALEAYERGARAMREGRVVLAVEAFGQAMEADPRFTLAQARLAEALHEAGYGRLARAAADHARDLAPQKATRLDQRRLKLMVQATHGSVFGDNEHWIEATAELLETFPDEPALMLEHARALSADQQFEEALQLLDRAQLVDSRNPLVRRERAGAQLSLERYEDARQTLRELRALFELLESDEGHAVVDVYLGIIAQAFDDYDGAIEHFARASERYEMVGRRVSAADTRLASQRVLLTQGRYDETEATIDTVEATSLDVGNLKLQAKALIARGALQYYRQDWDGAISNYLQAADLGRRLENSELKSQPLANASGLLVWLKRLDEARPVLAELQAVAEELRERNVLVSTLTTRADLAAQLGNLDQAVELYDQLLAMREDRPEAIFLSGTMAFAAVRRERGQLGAALELLDEAVAHSRQLERPMDLGRALQNRARVYSALGRAAAAEADMTELAAIAPEYPDLASATPFIRALMHLHRGEWEAVLVQPVERAGHPQENEPLAVCAALYHLGRLADARATCAVVLEHGGISPSERAAGRAWIALALADAGSDDDALLAALAARADARRMGLLIVEARAAAAIASLPAERRPADWRSAVGTGSAALDSVIALAPEQDRVMLEARPDLAHVRSRLRRAGGENEIE